MLPEREPFDLFRWIPFNVLGSDAMMTNGTVVWVFIYRSESLVSGKV